MRTIEIDELILVEVPKDAKHFTLIESHNYFKSPRIEHSIGGFDLDRKFDYEIIGLIETPNVDFDFEVDESWVEKEIRWDSTFYLNYIETKMLNELIKMFSLEDKKQSFRTRIQMKIQDAGMYLVNPMSNPFTTKQIGENYQKNTYITEWQFKEGKTIKGNLLLIKKLK